ncbi:antigen 5 like allergen Cul n 1-like [Eurosta solidaginis]|uniref:antigen 5 like allergen Cul n 1-like n=1 Tax=Eurosta solidaginis TaxID=178769 RepID=UPI003530C08E
MMATFLIFFIIRCLIANATNRTYSGNVAEYCELGCVNTNKTHGVCANPEKKLIENCPPDANIISLHEFQAIILSLHNEMRNSVAAGLELPKLPPAAHMGEMFWDKKLADLAEYSARRCLIADPYCYRTPECPEPGRSANNYKFPTTKVEYEQIVPSRVIEWLNTSAEVTPAMVVSFPEKPKGHADFFGRCHFGKK